MACTIRPSYTKFVLAELTENSTFIAVKRLLVVQKRSDCDDCGTDITLSAIPISPWLFYQLNIAARVEHTSSRVAAPAFTERKRPVGVSTDGGGVKGD